ncbi:hypothetical protein BDZ85DRAFT_8458 [Elsinoe ampelina]|uniref:Uncharacterized protein n=1 Tax=Elsinoe ampelina TaxID=302913 RepID=A0A6A6GQ66_9PEZI|nr:hypothetical protein BDZ85DRAFT_8458 [Elsinoe ampelina]
MSHVTPNVDGLRPSSRPHIRDAWNRSKHQIIKPIQSTSLAKLPTFSLHHKSLPINNTQLPFPSKTYNQNEGGEGGGAAGGDQKQGDTGKGGNISTQQDGGNSKGGDGGDASINGDIDLNKGASMNVGDGSYDDSINIGGNANGGANGGNTNVGETKGEANGGSNDAKSEGGVGGDGAEGGSGGKTGMETVSSGTGAGGGSTASLNPSLYRRRSILPTHLYVRATVPESEALDYLKSGKPVPEEYKADLEAQGWSKPAVKKRSATVTPAIAEALKEQGWTQGNKKRSVPYQG